MFESGLIKIGNDYIAPANKFFFCRVKEISENEPDKLEAQIEAATTKVYPLSNPFIFHGIYNCILFGAKDIPLLPFQVIYLEVIGVDIEDIDTYTFQIDSSLKTPVLMVYDNSDGSLLGGVMPMGMGND